MPRRPHETASTSCRHPAHARSSAFRNSGPLGSERTVRQALKDFQRFLAGKLLGPLCLLNDNIWAAAPNSVVFLPYQGTFLSRGFLRFEWELLKEGEISESHNCEGHCANPLRV